MEAVPRREENRRALRCSRASAGTGARPCRQDRPTRGVRSRRSGRGSGAACPVSGRIERSVHPASRRRTRYSVMDGAPSGRAAILTPVWLAGSRAERRSIVLRQPPPRHRRARRRSSRRGAATPGPGACAKRRARRGRKDDAAREEVQPDSRGSGRSHRLLEGCRHVRLETPQRDWTTVPDCRPPMGWEAMPAGLSGRQEMLVLVEEGERSAGTDLRRAAPEDRDLVPFLHAGGGRVAPAVQEALAGLDLLPDPVRERNGSCRNRNASARRPACARPAKSRRGGSPAASRSGRAPRLTA